MRRWVNLRRVTIMERCRCRHRYNVSESLRVPVGIVETSAALGASLLVLAVAIVLDRRPYRPGKRNYVPVMIIALAACLVFGRHLITLLM